MPIYEYACKVCGHEMEARQKFSDAPLTECPSCGASALERLVSNSSFALKGSGWYADGYGGKKSDGKSADSAPKESTSSDSGSKEKPAAASSESKASDTPKASSTSSASSEAKKAS